MTKKKLLENIAWLFFDKVLKIGGGLYISIWVARYLGATNFGILNYSIAFISFFILFSNLGLDQILVRDLVKKEKLTNYLLGTAFFLKLFGSIFSIFSIFGVLFFIELEFTIKLIIFILSFEFIFQTFNVISLFYQAKVLSKYVVIAQNGAFLISSLVKVYLITNEYDVAYFAVANVIYMLFVAVFLIIIYTRTKLKIKNWKFSKKIAISLLKQSWPLAISVLLITIHLKVDQLMIEDMLSIKDVGVYSVAVKLAEFWYFVPSILISTFMPYFTKIRTSDLDLYYYRLSQLYSLMFWMGIFIGIVVFYFGENIILFLFGEEYILAYTALYINIWAGIFVAQSYVRSIWMVNENLYIYRMIINIFAIIINISANLILIPIYGISGAAMATLLSLFLSIWIFPLFFSLLRGSTYAMVKSIFLIYNNKEYSR